MKRRQPRAEVLSGLKISQKLAQHNYKTEFLNAPIKYRWGGAPPPLCSFRHSSSLFSTPPHPSSMIAYGWMVARRQKRADRILSRMAECITRDISEHLHPRSPSKTRVFSVAPGETQKTHARTHKETHLRQTPLHFIGTRAHAVDDVLTCVSMRVHKRWDVAPPRAHTHTTTHR